MKTIRYLTFLLLITAVGCKQQDSRPNILLLVADDLGYADLGVYGGDIETPNIDKLANSGLRFGRFYASPLCSPTRAMLLSGTDNHTAGIGIQGTTLDHWGYEGQISDRVAIIPEILSANGYNTYMAGKWHLGSSDEANPHARGFTKSFINKGSSGNHYNSVGLWPVLPVSQYTENGVKTEWPEGAYSTDLFTDKLIQFIGEDLDQDRPFFAFGAYTSPHWPLQVVEKYWKKYEGRYDNGYEDLRSKRLESLKKAGLVPEDTKLPPLHPKVTPWDSLTGPEKMIEARKMELYAGMVDNLDANIGRLLNFLKEEGEYENTIIVFMSDNGAAAEDFYYHPRIGEYLKTVFSDSYEDMGQAQSYISYGPQWAEAGTGPFRYYKEYQTEGGLLAPMIVSGTGVNRSNETHMGIASLWDIAPTIYELAGIEFPGVHDGRDIAALRGKSFNNLLNGKSDSFWTNESVYAMEHAGRTFYRKGDWKLMSNQLPYDSANLGLYYLPNDIGEINDLKSENPEKYQELYSEWKQFMDETNVILPSPVKF